MKKLGPIANVLEMLPGMGGALRGAEVPDDSQLDRMEAIILSMTPAERVNARLLDGSRRRRIAAGSGTSVQEVNRLVRQVGEMEMLMKRMGITGKGKKKALRKFPFRFS
jgi:signal recognition particle subunit SRP54